LRPDAGHDRPMLVLLIVVVRGVAFVLRGHRELVLENVALRQQLATMKRGQKRVALNTRDRLFWIVLAQGWRNWRKALVFVQPDTVVSWHRDWLRRRWTRRSKRRPEGRPPIDPQIRALVRDMATANPLWGAPRVHGELRTLGVDVSERTVSRLLRPDNRPRSQTWKTFLTNHLTAAAAMDFFTVPTLTGRVLFVLVVMSHCRRRIVHFNVTEHPTATWRLNKSSRHFRTRPRRDGCIAIATASTARAFAGEWRAWASPRSSQLQRALGRIRTLNV
jgi:putative transposase